MQPINTLKERLSTKTSNLVLLAIATGGIYLIMWLYRNYQIFNEVTKSKTADDVYIIWIAVCVGLGGVVKGFQGNNSTLIMASFLLAMAGNVLWIVWAFRARKALQEYCLQEYKIDLTMNRFYTFLFSVFYINYCVNDLEEVERKHKILHQGS